MNQAAKDLIKKSWVIISDRTDDMIMVYEKLYQWSPDTRAMFNIGIEKQAKKLKDTLGFIVDHLDQEEDLANHSKSLGAGHSQYELKPEHYEKLNIAFIESIEEILGDEYDEEIGKAWKAALDEVSQMMIKHH